jgi:hypothetical protein
MPPDRLARECGEFDYVLCRGMRSRAGCDSSVNA